MKKFGLRLGEGLSEPSLLHVLQVGENGLWREGDVDADLGADVLQVLAEQEGGGVVPADVVVNGVDDGERLARSSHPHETQIGSSFSNTDDENVLACEGGGVAGCVQGVGGRGDRFVDCPDSRLLPERMAAPSQSARPSVHLRRTNGLPGGQALLDVLPAPAMGHGDGDGIHRLTAQVHSDALHDVLHEPGRQQLGSDVPRPVPPVLSGEHRARGHERLPFAEGFRGIGARVRPEIPGTPPHNAISGFAFDINDGGQQITALELVD